MKLYLECFLGVSAAVVNFYLSCNRLQLALSVFAHRHLERLKYLDISLMRRIAELVRLIV